MVAQTDANVLKKWYKKTELTLRISICLAAGLIATATGSLIAAGISSGLDGSHGLSAWRWVFLIEGIGWFSLVSRKDAGLTFFFQFPSVEDSSSSLFCQIFHIPGLLCRPKRQKSVRYPV